MGWFEKMQDLVAGTTYDDVTNTDLILGTQEQFEAKYGKTTSDGVPRFGEDYAFLHHPSELTPGDRVKEFVADALSS